MSSAGGPAGLATPADQVVAGEAVAAPPAARLRVWLFLLPLLLLTVGLRLRTFDEPLERDLTTYAVVAHELLSGRQLYSQVWEHKPPGTFVAYAAAELALGPGPTAVFAVNVAAAIATLLALYAAGRRLTDDARGGLWAAALWTLVSMTPFLQANQPNTEVLVNALGTWALVVLLAPRSGDPTTRRDPAGCGELSWPQALGFGALAAAATLCKQVALPPLALAAAVHVAGLGRDAAGAPPGNGASRAWGRDANGVSWRGWPRRLVRVAAGLALVPLAWAATWGYFAAQGRAAAFAECVFAYNSAYVVPLAQTAAAAIGFGSTWFLFLAVLPPAVGWLLPGDGATGARRHGWALLTAFSAGTAVAVALPGYFYAHYYQLWLPVLCLSFAVSWDLLRSIPRPGAVRAAHLACLVVWVGVLLPHLAPLVSWTPERWSREKYGEQFVEARQWGVRIGQLLRREETLWNYGSDTGLYFYSGKRPGSRAFYDLPLALLASPEGTHRRLAGDLLAGMVDYLERGRPDLVVVRATRRPLPIAGADPVLALLARRYLLLRGMPADAPFALLVRDDSPLRARLPAFALAPPAFAVEER